MALKNSYPNLFSFCTNPGDDNWSNHEWDISFRRYLNDWKWIDWLNSYKKSTASKALLQSPTQSYGNKLMMVKTLRTDYKKRREQPGCGIEPWKQIWKSLAPTKVRCFSAPTKVKCFSWLVARKACLAQEILKRRGFQIVSRCFLCNEAEETNSHLLLHCKITAQIWSLFLSLTNKMDNARTCCRSVELMD